jgi:hypothetical protein
VKFDRDRRLAKCACKVGGGSWVGLARGSEVGLERVLEEF